MKNPITLLMLGAIRLYQVTLSPWVGRQCRYLPTCSQYGMEAIARFGPVKGGYLTLMRIGRCHPLGGGGYDPVPSKFRWRCWCDACRAETAADKSADGSSFFKLQNR